MRLSWPLFSCVAALGCREVSVLIDEDETELAVRVLHTAYGLDAVEDAA